MRQQRELTMTRATPFLLLAMLISQPSATAANTDPEEKDPVLVLRNVTIFDGSGDAMIPGGTIVIEGEVISSISFDHDAAVPDEALILNLEGQYVIPGIIDAHVHISHDTRDTTEEALAQALSGGVTSVRDMGGDARRLASLKRDAQLGEIKSPDIYYSAVFAGPTFFDDPRVIDVTRGVTPGAAAWARAITSETDLQQAVAEAKGSGASAIKIYTDLGVDLITSITNAAHAQNMKVWSHSVVFPSRPGDTVGAGVDVISHSSGLYWEVADQVPKAFGPHRQLSFEQGASSRKEFAALFGEMRNRGTILDATIFVIQYSSDHAPSGEEQKRRAQRLKFANEITNAAYRSGVLIAAGSDNMIDTDQELPVIHDELGLLVENCGLSPAAAIRSATSINAKALGIDDTTGYIQEGKQADLVVLSADPLEDIDNTRSIRFVIKRGKLHVRH
jgi:imidazolonepropionase-like amidohydrolase